MQIHFQGRFISRWNDDIFNHMLILVSDNLSSPLTQSFQIYFRILTKLSTHVYFLLSIKKVLMRMQQKQVTKKAAVARKVKGRRGVTILTLLCWLSEIIKSKLCMRGWPMTILIAVDLSEKTYTWEGHITSANPRIAQINPSSQLLYFCLLF